MFTNVRQKRIKDKSNVSGLSKWKERWPLIKKEDMEGRVGFTIFCLGRVRNSVWTYYVCLICQVVLWSRQLDIQVVRSGKNYELEEVREERAHTLYVKP